MFQTLTEIIKESDLISPSWYTIAYLISGKSFSIIPTTKDPQFWKEQNYDPVWLHQVNWLPEEDQLLNVANDKFKSP